MKIKRAILIVLDSVGIGQAPDAAQFGDEGAHTLLHIAERVGLHLPHLAGLGLGNIIPLPGIPPTDSSDQPDQSNQSMGGYGKAQEKSQGKDTVTGHWEIAGIITPQPFPSYPDGFPTKVIEEFEKKIGRETLGNKAASGTAIIAELGDEHVRTGRPIVYTSADSVFQIAAHEGTIPLEELYGFCEIAREMLDVNRIIARPFSGEQGNYTRTSNRRDYALAPPQDTLLDEVKAAGLPVVAIGKISDIFAGRGITHKETTHSNSEGIDRTLHHIREGDQGLVFTNLVDFDTLYGHRRDPEGYRYCLEEFDSRLPELLEALKPGDLLLLTADHGCDPTYRGSDHTREQVPILVAGDGIRGADLGERETYADIAATLRELLLGKKSSGSFASALYSHKL